MNKKKNKKSLVPNNSYTEFLLYTTPNGKVKVEIFLRDETVWLTQAKIAELFDVERSVITKHLQNIYETNELSKEATCAKIAQVQTEGGRKVNRNIEFYNLDAIISVGYRVNSSRATHFRIWATERLKEYIIKGFTMDDERLKNPNNIFGKDYFKEQLARIMTRTAKLHNAFLPRYRTSCIGLSAVKRPPRLFIPVPIAKKQTWD